MPPILTQVSLPLYSWTFFKFPPITSHVYCFSILCFAGECDQLPPMTITTKLCTSEGLRRTSLVVYSHEYGMDIPTGLCSERVVNRLIYHFTIYIAFIIPIYILFYVSSFVVSIISSVHFGFVGAGKHPQFHKFESTELHPLTKNLHTSYFQMKLSSRQKRELKWR